jgi:hypothetical protein
VVAVTRAGVPRLEAAELIGQEGDRLHIAVLKDAIGELETRFAAGAAPTVGAGEGRRA